MKILRKLSQVIDAIRCPNTSCNARYHKSCAKLCTMFRAKCSKCKKEFIRIPVTNYNDEEDDYEDEVSKCVNYWFKLPKWFFSSYLLKVLQYTAPIQEIDINDDFFSRKIFIIESYRWLYRKIEYTSLGEVRIIFLISATLLGKWSATKMFLICRFTFLPLNWGYSDISSEIIDDYILECFL